MSNIKVQGNVSGTGSLTIAAPNTNSDRTLSIPDQTGELMATGGGPINVSTSAADDSVVLDANGNLGLGVTPSAWSSSNNVALQFNTTGFVQQDSATNVGIGRNAYQDGGWYYGANGYATMFNQESDGVFKWFSVPSGTAGNAISFTQAMTLNQSGALLVGTTTNRGRIHAANNGGDPNNTSWTSFSYVCSGAYGGGIAMLDGGTTGYGLWTDDLGNDFNIAQGTTSSGLSGGVYINNAAGSWSARSDERDKINLEPITNAIEKVTQLRTVIGEYVWAEGVRHPFLIAQDVQAVLPEAVSIANKSAPEEAQRLGVSYTDTIPLLVAAIQEQQALITSLTARIEALEAK